jgi:hypothetical protein
VCRGSQYAPRDLRVDPGALALATRYSFCPGRPASATPRHYAARQGSHNDSTPPNGLQPFATLGPSPAWLPGAPRRGAYAPSLAGHRHVTVTDRRTAVDFAQEVRDLLEVHYPHAERVVLVIDNLNTHRPAALYGAFEPAVARSLIERLEIHHTPKQGSGLNRAEIELSLLSRQCLDRRISDADTLTREVAA